ncbi:unnamed protein product [Oppiella nova]|uniref:Protein kinase domain-containing protein n=1 Tax=Oppiella nova TaxID=334625 RepID=A0A7R9LXS5_9ACAR|nr:unnamed protein product [Oppiella nova]CAG2167946.1 unnamed protein product [Oppiella nova]
MSLFAADAALGSIINNFTIFAKVPDTLKQQIKLFYVFDDGVGHNVVFVTSDDSVYGMGINVDGELGFDNIGPVESARLMSGLCQQNIRKFFHGSLFVLAIDERSRIYSFGHLSWVPQDDGQLGRDTSGDDFYKPTLLPYFSNGNIKISQVSCGNVHTLILAANGQVHGWGGNKHGQVGCGKLDSDNVSDPKIIVFPDGHQNIKLSRQKRILTRLDAKSKENILNEASNLITLRNEFSTDYQMYVIDYVNSWLENDCLYIEMELCYDSLKNFLKVLQSVSETESESGFRIRMGFEILIELTECVQYLHDHHIIHRDLKPDNVLIARHIQMNQTRYLKLCDLGVSKDFRNLDSFSMSAVQQTQEVGSPDYMAPEAEEDSYNHKIDIYSLALIGAEIFGFNKKNITQGKKLD